jgi:HlyD family secretion protein
MKRRNVVLSIVGVLLAGGALAWAFAPRPVDVEIGRASTGMFESTIDEDGKTRLPDRYVISAPLAGRLSRIALRAGDDVAVGTVVATLAPVLSPMLDERSAREAQARVEAAQALLQRAAVRVERARVAVEQVRIELRRSEQLAKDGFIAPTKLDADRLAMLAAGKELEAAQQERHVAEHDLEQARAAQGAMRASLVALPSGRARGGPAPSAGSERGGTRRSEPETSSRAFEVKSPIAGQVLRVVQPSEGTVALGTPLLEVGHLDTLEVVVELLTTDAPRAQPGTPVRLERWGGDGVIEGRVKRVEPAAFTKVSALGVEEQRVNLIVDVTSPREQWKALGDGFRVSARIVVVAVNDVLLVPAAAVFPLPDADDHRMAVFVVEGGRARLEPVKVAGRNGTAAWVSEGLAKDAKVIVYPPAAVRDGVRVRERKV